MTTIFDEFQWRGLVHSFTEGLPDVVAQQKVTVYIGFDPTSNSLQVGNLLALMGLARMQRFGHSPIALAGGGTGMIGDPSGKKEERALLTREEIEANIEPIKVQLAHFLDFEVKSNPARVMNNADWLMPISMMDFLRDVGKYFTVNYMITKDSVKTRLEREDGISYTEFTYMLLQAYDFLHLYEAHGCQVQSGGSDQWGNITAGVELIRRKLGQRAYALVYPLVTGSNGEKLGKTATGAIYLDPARTSPYQYYQFWMNQEDAVVIDYLKYFTWLNQEEIADYADKTARIPEQRAAQRKLAQEMTRATHGESALARAEQAAQALFGGDIQGLGAADIADIFADSPSTSVPRHTFLSGVSVVDLMVTAGLARGKGEARRAIEGGGIYLNNVRISDLDKSVTLADAIEGQYFVLRKGKKTYHLVQVID